LRTAFAGSSVLSRFFERTVVVAVIAMRVMQVPVDEIVDMITVRHRFVPASRPMYMPRLVTLAAVFRRATVGVYR
jgi:hypothetical protein